MVDMSDSNSGNDKRKYKPFLEKVAKEISEEFRKVENTTVFSLYAIGKAILSLTRKLNEPAEEVIDELYDKMVKKYPDFDLTPTELLICYRFARLVWKKILE